MRSQAFVQSFFLTGSLHWLLSFACFLGFPASLCDSAGPVCWAFFAAAGRFFGVALGPLPGFAGRLVDPEHPLQVALALLLLRATRTTLHESHHGMPLEYASPPRRAFHVSVL